MLHSQGPTPVERMSAYHPEQGRQTLHDTHPTGNTEVHSSDFEDVHILHRLQLYCTETARGIHRLPRNSEGG